MELLRREALFELLFLSEQTVTLKLLRTISATTPRNKNKKSVFFRVPTSGPRTVAGAQQVLNDTTKRLFHVEQ